MHIRVQPPQKVPGTFLVRKEKPLKKYHNPVMIKVMKKQINKYVSVYLSEIGRVGGLKSRRKLDSKTAHDMVRLREARRLYKKYHTQCFWSYDPQYVVRLSDIPWLCEQLMKNGNRKLWMLGAKLCR